MIDGRIVTTGGKDLGSGFCLTDRIVATAAHVVRDRAATDLAFVTSSGIRVPVEAVDSDPTIDCALLRVAESLAVVPPLAHATLSAQWRVTARPQGAAVQLTGAVSATDHLVVNAGGHEMTVLQLRVVEELRDYGGYSGSAVTVDNAVVGLLVEQVPERASYSGMRRLAANVLYAVPVDRMVARFRLGLRIARPAPVSPVQQLLDTAYFDLDRLKTAILEAKSAADGRLLAFGVDCDEMLVVANLCAWLPPYVGEIAQKGVLTLRPETFSLDTTVNYVTRYRSDLDRVNVVCPVLVDGVPGHLVAEFWARVRDAYRRTPHWLVLFLVGTPAGGYPDTVTVLPRPAFGARDVATWASHVTAFRRWPSSLAEAWSRAICAQATVDDALDTRITYEVLEHFIERVRREPAQLRDYLEELEAEGC
ncbi:serine protease [Plantactinospora sp. B24E8]|uniref:S1 family peptidase n=1 Tax=Plantactinospora sp. B24E8 TaxID=3153567 RepID=UPI00325DB8DB